jgi:hypothetical protein
LRIGPLQPSARAGAAATAMAMNAAAPIMAFERSIGMGGSPCFLQPALANLSLFPAGCRSLSHGCKLELKMAIGHGP